MALCAYYGLNISSILGKNSQLIFLILFFFLIECTLVQFLGDCTRSNDDSGIQDTCASLQ